MALSDLEQANAVDLPYAQAEWQLVGRMRLVLALAVLLVVLSRHEELADPGTSATLVAAIYLLHALLVYACGVGGSAWATGRPAHWMDLCWISVIVLATGGVDSIFYLFFFFPILTSSFRYGMEEGARVTVASSVLFALSGIGTPPWDDLPQVLLCTIFLLSLGYMSAQWGQSKIEYSRRLALLRDVSRISNPRFGVERTLHEALQRTLLFFRGDALLLVLQDSLSGEYTLRTVKAAAVEGLPKVQSIDAAVGQALLSLPSEDTMHFDGGRPGWRARWQAALGQGVAHQASSERSAALAELLEAQAFLSVCVQLGEAKGRLYICGRQRWRRCEAGFLAHAVAYAFSVIEKIALLDRLATEAAGEERKRLGWNLHDAAIQPYLGLHLGLSALRNNTAPTNPVHEDIERLSNMSEAVIREMRQFAGRLRSAAAPGECVLSTALKQRVDFMKTIYGIEVALHAAPLVGLSDRLAAEVLYLVSEGLSNICRHTSARRGRLHIESRAEQLSVVIENEADSATPACFMPRSLSERAAALGGQVDVQASPHWTTVQISIPV